MGRYIVGYTVRNLVLRRHASGAVKLNFRPYIQRYTSPNENFEYSYPLSGNSFVNHVNELPGINGDQRRSGVLSESFNGNLDTSRNRGTNNRSLAEDELPDLDSPVQPRSGIKSKSFKKHVIESSDEQSDADSDGKNSGEDIAMNHSARNEDLVAEHSDHDDDKAMNHSAKNEDLVAEHSDYDDDISMNHSAKNEDFVTEHSDGNDDNGDIDLNHSDINEDSRHSDNNVRENVNSFINGGTEGNSDSEAQEDDGEDDDGESGESTQESEGDESSEEEEENGIQGTKGLL